MSDLLEDVILFTPTLEEAASSGNLRVSGVFQRADVLNENGRVYPRSLWEKALANDTTADAVKNRAMFGELDHPSDGKTKLSRVAHVITNLTLNSDGEIIGEAEILPTPNGKVLRALFESGTRVGISSRGSGSVQTRSDGAKQVQEDFKLSTFDFVARPSTPGAIPKIAPQKATSVREEADLVPAATIESAVTKTDDDTFRRVTILGSDIKVIGEDISRSRNMSQEEISFYDETLTALNASVLDLQEDSPEYTAVLHEMLLEIAENRAALYGEDVQLTDTNNQEDQMDRKEFIKSRLQKIMTEEVDDDVLYEEEEDNDTISEDELRERLEQLPDEELVAVADEMGLLAEDDGSDEIDADEIDVEALYEYAVELETELERVSSVAQQLSEALEEAEDEGLALKYEAALGVLAEMVSEYDRLVEAVGGEENANKLVEAFDAKNSTVEDDPEDPKLVKEHADTDDAAAILEEIMTSGGGKAPKVNVQQQRAVELANKAIKSLGYN